VIVPGSSVSNVLAFSARNRHDSIRIISAEAAILRLDLAGEPFSPKAPVVCWACPKYVYIFRTASVQGSVRNMNTNIGPTTSTHRGPKLDLRRTILDRIKRHKSIRVWTPNDFLDLGARSAIDKALQRLVLAGDIRRIDRGLYDVPRANLLTGKPSTPDYTAIIDAVARREKARFLPDGITAANQLGLTDAVPAKVTVHTDARLRPIQLDSLVINFKPTAPSRLYWAGRPAMRIVQALHWLHDMLPTNGDSILKRISRILDDPKQGAAIRNDLRSGLDSLPGWMRDLVTGLLQERDQSTAPTPKSFSRATRNAMPGPDDRSTRQRS
jgi:hypothetical protein